MNNVILIGNLTKDPELRQTSSGISCCTFTIAVNRNYKSANGEVETDYIPIVVWRAQADNCAKYIGKGSKVAVNGSIQVRTYEAKDGSTRYVTEVVANNVEFLSKRQESGDKDLTPVNEQLPF